MIKVSVLYPNTEGTTFDHDYYKNSHMVLVKKKMTPNGLRSTAIDKGVAGGAPGSPAPFHAMGHLLFDSMEDFQKAFSDADEVMADIPNYTNAEPQILISEVVE